MVGSFFKNPRIILAEDEDSPTEEVTEEVIAEPKKKSRGRPKGSVKKVEEEPEQVPVEIVEAEKDLANMEWHPVLQQPFDGYQNIKMRITKISKDI